MDSKSYIDKITVEFLSGKNRYSKLNRTNRDLNKDDISFYRKRIVNTTRELIKKILDPSYNEYNNNSTIIDNNSIQNEFKNYIETLIYTFKQDDMKDIINNHNGFDNNITGNIINNDNSNCDVNDSDILLTDTDNIDKNLFNKPINIKNKYDWSNFCTIDKKPLETKSMPKITEFNLKNPSLRNKGIKNKKYRDNIVDNEKK